MKVLLTGATGLLGGALLELLLAEGHEVRCLVREGSPPRLAPGPAPHRSRPRGRGRRARSLAGTLRGGRAIARRGDRVRSGCPRGRTWDRSSAARGSEQHERALDLCFPVWPEAPNGGTGASERVGLHHRASVHDLRLRAGQEHAPPPALPGPLAPLPYLRFRGEPLAAGLPRGLRKRRLRGSRAARGRKAELRPARRRAPDLP